MAPVSVDEIRRVLQVAVRRIAPAWLADESEDLVQAAFIRIMKVNQSEESDTYTSSYLWKVAHSAVMDEIRGRRRRREMQFNDGEAVDAAGPNNAEPAQESGEIRQMIHEGLGRLRESRRLAVLLFLYGYSMDESTKMLGWTSKQLDNNRYRGLADLRRFLSERGYGS